MRALPPRPRSRTGVGDYPSHPTAVNADLGSVAVSGLDFRFSWPENVPVEAARSDYEVSGTDWLTLVEKFGLASQVKKNA